METAIETTRTEEGGDLVEDGTHRTLVPAPLSFVLNEIRGLHRQRVDLHRAEKRLTLQIKAIGRRIGEDHSNRDNQGDVVLSTFAAIPLEDAREVVRKARKALERRLQKAAKSLPVWSWVEGVHGFGALGLGQIVGEAGDLSDYANPAKVWKRFGLAVIGGKAQGRRKGLEALVQGYSPERRSIMFCIGDSLIKKQNGYREVYLDRKEVERGKMPDAAPIHIHRRAQRYMEKRLLRDLWKAWRRTTRNGEE